MGTPLYSTDIKTVLTRPELSALDAGDFYLVYDTSTGKISKIKKARRMHTLNLLASIGANADDILLRENPPTRKSTLSENSRLTIPTRKQSTGLNLTMAERNNGICSKEPDGCVWYCYGCREHSRLPRLRFGRIFSHLRLGDYIDLDSFTVANWHNGYGYGIRQNYRLGILLLL